MSTPADETSLSAPNWLRASRTAAPAVALVGCLIVAAEAVRRLQVIAEREERVVSDDALVIYEIARHDAWLLMIVALGGGMFGLLLALARSGRWGWSIGLGLVGVVLIAQWGMVVNAIPFLAAAGLAWVGDDTRLHPEPDDEAPEPAVSVDEAVTQGDAK